MDRGEDQQGAAQQEGQVGGGHYEVGSGGSVTPVSGKEIMGSASSVTEDSRDPGPSLSQELKLENLESQTKSSLQSVPPSDQSSPAPPAVARMFSSILSKLIFPAETFSTSLFSINCEMSVRTAVMSARRNSVF